MLNRKEAFTLIELLVVIAIIGLLISLLTPSLGRARERAREIACLSKERQMGLAIYLFAGDNNGYLPQQHSRNTSPWSFPDYSWAAQIWPYLGDGGWPQFARFFHCPSDEVPYKRGAVGAMFQSSYDGTNGWFSYGYNQTAGCAYYRQFGMGAWPGDSPHFTQKQLSYLPSDGILLSETRCARWIMLNWLVGYDTPGATVKFTHGSPGASVRIPDNIGNPLDGVVPEHEPYGGGDRANLLHVDGSARAYSIDEVYGLHKNLSSVRRWRFR